MESDNLVTQLRNLIAEARSIAKQARRGRNLSVAMQGIDRQTRVLELIARLTGELDESTRVNVLVAQRQAAEARAGRSEARSSMAPALGIGFPAHVCAGNVCAP